MLDIVKKTNWWAYNIGKAKMQPSPRLSPRIPKLPVGGPIGGGLRSKTLDEKRREIGRASCRERV